MAIIVVFLAALFVDLPGTNSVAGHNVAINKGIDIAGGVAVRMCTKANVHPSASDMSTARDVINARVSGGFGVSEPQVTVVGGNCINVELPGAKNQNQVIKTIGHTGFLAITDAGATQLGNIKGPSALHEHGVGRLPVERDQKGRESDGASPDLEHHRAR